MTRPIPQGSNAFICESLELTASHIECGLAMIQSIVAPRNREEPGIELDHETVTAIDLTIDSLRQAVRHLCEYVGTPPVQVEDLEGVYEIANASGVAA